jgi:hypothetical protein
LSRPVDSLMAFMSSAEVTAAAKQFTGLLALLQLLLARYLKILLLRKGAVQDDTNATRRSQAMLG